jgi:hypothetical protein
MTEGPLYVYGLIASEPGAGCIVLGEGLGAAPVRLFDGGALTALVTPIAPGQVAQTRRNMVAHTAVLERAMIDGTVLPVRFGTVAPDAAALERCIAGNAASLRRALHSIDGRVELGLKASWREGLIYDEIVAADDELRRLRDRLRSRPAGETYYERVELGRRVEAALVLRRTAETSAIIAELSVLADKEVELRALGEGMILNRAFLVRREREREFDARMEAIVERRGARISLRYVGPVPPYNFVRLRADWLAAAS